MIRRARILTFFPALLLGACASVPSTRPPAPATPVVAPPAAKIKPPVIRSVLTDEDGAPVDVWSALRHSFAMADCDAGQAVVRQAMRYTRNPRRFESHLEAVLPRLAYVQQAAQRHQVPGEFVLLPWVESHFRPVKGSHGRPAGMWQIMPATASAMGLRIDHHYDGRLDLPASSDAVMALLSRYHTAFDDWRIADYAYNAGEFAVRRIIRRHGMPPATPMIPDWPVSKVTRKHLIRLLAMACIVREPARFNVQLPDMPAARRLVKVPIHRSISLHQAARDAGMSVSAMKSLNAAFKNDRINAGKTAYLILPAGHVKKFGEALEHRPQWASVDGPRNAGANHSAASDPVHTVQRGESLWSIAHRYSVQISQLRQWNHLQGDALAPGRVLQVGSSD